VRKVGAGRTPASAARPAPPGAHRDPGVDRP